MNSMDFFGDAVSTKSEGNTGSTISDKTLAFGIDLGTTNSAISVVLKGNTPDIIPLDNKRHTMPSCVMWTGNGREFVVGKEAYEHRMEPNVIYSVKSFMQDPNKVIDLEYNGEHLQMTPVEVSAEILKALVKQVGDFYGDIKDVVVTVPAMFNNIGKENTKKACELAGLNLLGLLTEPTAASLCCDVLDDTEEQKDVLVYDLGGGTFDVSLIRISKPIEVSDDFADMYGIEDTSNEDSEDLVNNRSVLVVGNGGNPKLGGDDIDRELYEWVVNRLESECGVNRHNITDYEKETIILTLEDFKKKGTKKMYSFTPKLSAYPDIKPIVIGEEDFRKALLPIYTETQGIIETVMRETGVQADTIVLVGGSTKNPLLYEMLEKDYPSFVINNLCEPDESVALGAAIQAKNKKFGDTGVSVTDSLPISIGIESDNRLTHIIEKNEAFPIAKTRDFTTWEDNQEVISINVYQGDSTSIEKAVCLGTLVIDNLPKATSGDILIRVTLSINANGILVCSVRISSLKMSFDSIERQLKLELNKQTDAKPVLTREEKLKRKWVRFASKLEGSEQQELLSLVSNFPETTSRQEIEDFINARLDINLSKSKK